MGLRAERPGLLLTANVLGAIASEPSRQDVQAFRTETALSTRLGALQIKRVFERFGFEPVVADSSFMAQPNGLGECLVKMGLTRAFNPLALAHQPVLRDSHELWISRTTLPLRYAERNGGIANEPMRRRGA